MPTFTVSFLGEGSPTKIDSRKQIGYPYSNLSAGGPRFFMGKPEHIILSGRIHKRDLKKRVVLKKCLCGSLDRGWVSCG